MKKTTVLDSKKCLSRKEQDNLDSLSSLPSKAVSRCADVLHNDYFRYHRGTMILNGYKLVFGNDGFNPDGSEDDIRSRLEVVKVVQAIERINKFWGCEVFKITGFGLSEDRYTWALRVETGYFDWGSVLEAAVWDSWFRATGLAPENHPFPNRLRQEIRQMFFRHAA